MVKFAKVFSLILILSLGLAACSPARTATAIQQNTAATPAVGEGYPAGETTANPATEDYPGPLAATDDPLSQYPQTLAVVKPEAGKGVITGRVLEITNDEVYLAPSLLLGNLVYSDDPEMPPLVGFSETTSPQGVQDRAGKFMFANVKPGKYAVVVWTPGSSTLLTDKEGNTAIIEVAADQAADMGDIYVP